MLRCILFIAACCIIFGHGAYQPGNPGGPWSKDELLIVKAKIFKLFRKGMAPRVLRLGFHDCVKYTDGTGGCDGCLNWKGMNIRHTPIVDLGKEKANINSTDNNGLSWPLLELEKIYKDPNYPAGAPSLGQSLYDSGKSRADLWAFAAIVAVEYGIETTNIACDNMQDVRILKPSCIHDSGADCKVTPARNFKFQYGRSDCTVHHPTRNYIARKDEIHPNPIANGEVTIDFFRDYFGFSGRETAAIMGAHTFGKLHNHISIFKYEWTSRGIHLFNNDYYRGITGQKRWFIDDPFCRKIGDAFGNKPDTMWVAHTRKLTNDGGPVFWVHRNHACPSFYNARPLGRFEQKCVDEAGPGMHCRADPPAGGNQPRTVDQADGDINTGCERFKAILVHDNVALNSDMGLYREFEVTDGIIHGCPGLEHFNESMSSDAQEFIWSRLPGVGLAQPLCQKQRRAEPPGSTCLHQIMEEYANDQTAWINDFIPTLEKMLRNGYSSLTDAPDYHVDQYCPLYSLKRSEQDKYVLCYESSPAGQDETTFMITSKLGQLDGKVYQYNSDTGVFDFAAKSGTANQLWRKSVNGRQLINEAIGQPLEIEGNVNWNVEELGNGDIVLVNPQTSLVVDCWRAREEGKPCRTWEKNGNSNQRFLFIDQ